MYIYRHTLRRKNKVVGQRAVTMTGISVLPLGYDDAGREYWKFPVSEDLFICTQPLSDVCQAEFQERLLQEAREMSVQNESDGVMDVDIQEERKNIVPTTTATTATEGDRNWKRISDVSSIRRIVELLGTSSSEQALRTNVINALLLERSANAAAVAAATATTTATETASSAESKTDEDLSASSAVGAEERKNTTTTGNLNSWVDRSRSSGSLAAVERTNSIEDLRKKPIVDLVPAGMRLITARGQEIMSNYVIQEETVFEEDAGDSDEEIDDEDETTPVNEYFTFSRGRK